MNTLYCGEPCDLNIGNGKTVSGVGALIDTYILQEKIIFSNIKLIGVPYVELTPHNIHEVLETENAVVLFDEIHAILDIHHKVSPSCKHHMTQGLCYDISEMFRQVRKKKILTVSTAQTFGDCVRRLRIVIQDTIYCRKYDISSGRYKECMEDNCPPHHVHRIKQVNERTGQIKYFDPSLYYACYDSSEIVRGWQDCEMDVQYKKM